MNKNAIRVTFIEEGLETALGGFHTPTTMLMERFQFNKYKHEFVGKYTTSDDEGVKETVEKEEVKKVATTDEEVKEVIVEDAITVEETPVVEKVTKKKNKK